jgi:hypothetical protein
MPMKITAEEIDAKKTPKGGWTSSQLAQWGVPWPPPYKWRQALIQGLEPDHFLKKKLERPVFNHPQSILELAHYHISVWEKRGNHELVKIFTQILEENAAMKEKLEGSPDG